MQYFKYKHKHTATTETHKQIGLGKGSLDDDLIKTKVFVLVFTCSSFIYGRL